MIWLLALALAPPAAADCAVLCAGDVTDLSALPPSGAADVPTSSGALVPSWVTAAGFFDQTGQLYVDGVVKPLEPGSAWSQLLPVSALPAATTIEVWSLDAQTGGQVEVLTTFVTGDAIDDAPPAAPEGLVVTSGNDPGGHCTPKNTWVEATWSAGAEPNLHHEVQFVHPDHHATSVVLGLFASADSATGCGASMPGIVGGGPVEVQVRAIDLSGNVGPWSEAVTVEVEGRSSLGCATAPAPTAGAGMGTWLAWGLLWRR